MKTERLYLREQTRQILEELIKQSREEQLVFFGLENTSQLNVELQKINTKLINNKTNWVKWDIIEKSSNNVIGSCLYHNWEIEHKRAELGYSLYDQYRKKGFMRESINKIIEYGFYKMKLNRIEAFISPNNIPSIKLIKSLGFKQEGVLRDHYMYEQEIHDSVVFSLLRREYNQ